MLALTSSEVSWFPQQDSSSKAVFLLTSSEASWFLAQSRLVKAVFLLTSSEVSWLSPQSSSSSAVFLLRSNEVSWFFWQSSFVKAVKCSMPVRSPMDLLIRVMSLTSASSAEVKCLLLSLSKLAT